MNDKPRILFVDDEKRVLNSMRGMFRREYELILTTEGSEAVRLASEKDVDVIVADQRMPGMNGTEVLGAVKESAPRAVRILLTGYADPKAVAGSINIGEVFRFLSKPCPPDLLKETLKLAVEASRNSIATEEAKFAAKILKQEAAKAEPVETNTDNNKQTVTAQKTEDVAEEPATAPVTQATPAPAPPAAAQSPDSAHSTDADSPPADSNKQEAGPAHWQTVENIVMSSDDTSVSDTDSTVTNEALNVANFSNRTQGVNDVGVVIFTIDSEFAESAIRALPANRSTILATTLVKVAQAIENNQAGILITDFTTDNAVLQKMIGALKQHLPELVTIVVSDSHDTDDMISLINYGQIFRFIVKPIVQSEFLNDVNAAAVRYLYLLNNPESVIRHKVIESPPVPSSSSTLDKFLGKIRRIHSHRR